MGYVAGGCLYRTVLRRRIDHAERLIRLLDGLIQTAKATGKRSQAVDYADFEIKDYKNKYITPTQKGK